MTRSEFLEQLTVRTYLLNIVGILIAKEAGAQHLLPFAIAAAMSPIAGIMLTCAAYFWKDES